MKIPSGFYAILGAAVTAAAVLGGQIYESRQASYRHIRALAYEAATEEWKTRANIMFNRWVETGKFTPPPDFEIVMARHLALAAYMQKHGPETHADKDLAKYMSELLNEHNRKAEERVSRVGPNNESHEQGLPDAKKD